jgi:hypothetical protein
MTEISMEMSMTLSTVAFCGWIWRQQEEIVLFSTASTTGFEKTKTLLIILSKSLTSSAVMHTEVPGLSLCA